MQCWLLIGLVTCTNITHSSFNIECRELLSHIYSTSEANQCADTLTRLGTTMQQDFVTFDSPPVVLCLQLFFDSVDVKPKNQPTLGY